MANNSVSAPDPSVGTPQQERYSRSLKENTDARSEVRAATGTAASGFSPQEAPRRISADDMAELNRQISDYKARCDRGETVSGSDARWLLNELIYAYDHSVGTPPSADDQTTFDIEERLHDILTRYGIASRSVKDGMGHLPTELISWAASACRQSQSAELTHLRAELDQLRKDIDGFWFHVKHAYSMESREWFEREAPKMGFGSPLAMAAHHMWKRNPKVEGYTALLIDLRALVDWVLEENGAIHRKYTDSGVALTAFALKIKARLSCEPHQ